MAVGLLLLYPARRSGMSMKQFLRACLGTIAEEGEASKWLFRGCLEEVAKKSFSLLTSDDCGPSTH